MQKDTIHKCTHHSFKKKRCQCVGQNVVGWNFVHLTSDSQKSFKLGQNFIQIHFQWWTVTFVKYSRSCLIGTPRELQKCPHYADISRLTEAIYIVLYMKCSQNSMSINRKSPLNESRLTGFNCTCISPNHILLEVCVIPSHHNNCGGMEFWLLLFPSRDKIMKSQPIKLSQINIWGTKFIIFVFKEMLVTLISLMLVSD